MQVTIRVRMSAHDAHYGGNTTPTTAGIWWTARRCWSCLET